MKTKNLFVLSSILTLALATPAQAGAPDGVLRIFASSANPTGDWSGDLDIGAGPMPAGVEADTAAGFGAVYEVRLNDRWGVESGVIFTDFDFELEVAGSTVDFGSALAIPLTLGANFHILSGERVDLFVGPQLVYTLWGDLDTPVGTVTIDGDFGFGAVLGLDTRLGESNWSFNVGLRYLQMSLSDDSADVDVDPVFAELGFGYRF